MGSPVKSKIYGSVSEWLKYRFSEKKFSTLIGLALLIIWAVSIAYITQEINPFTVVILLILTGVFILRICLRYPLLGLYFTSVFSSFFALPGRFYNVLSPIGILVEVFTYVLWIAVLRKSIQQRTDQSGFWRSPITLMLVVLLLYYLVELANPLMQNNIGWIFYFRKQISFFLIFFISYCVLDSYGKIKFYLKFWLGFALLIALYGIKQQWFGLADFEKTWLQSDPVIMKLYFQAGFLRKFSLLTDPAAFGILCSCFGVFTLILALRIHHATSRWLLYLATVIFFLATAYSGTRTCIVMIGAGMIAYCILTIKEKKTYWLLLTAGISVVVLLSIPFRDSPVLNRVKTVFSGSREASVSVRNANRHKIQPYMRSHPFGGGLNTSSMEGKLYNPGHTLAGFPPDSGYMKILLEQGWVGFAINLLVYFIILKQGIDGFFNATKPFIKTIFIAMTIFLFSLIVGQFSQISIAQYPLILFYYSALAVFIQLNHYDDQKQMQ